MNRLLLSLFGLLIFSGCAIRPEMRQVARWSAPAGTWAGLELVALEGWDGIGPNRRMASQFLELRCAAQPSNLAMRRPYWPGPDWSGQVLWESTGVTYQHGTRNPRIHELTFQAKDIRQLLPCLARP